MMRSDSLIFLLGILCRSDLAGLLCNAVRGDSYEKEARRLLSAGGQRALAAVARFCDSTQGLAGVHGSTHSAGRLESPWARGDRRLGLGRQSRI